MFRGSPKRSSRAAPSINARQGRAISSCTHKSRSAEQRWPAERKAEVVTSSATCSSSAVESTIIALTPPVSAMSGTIKPGFSASARLIVLATSSDPVKTTPAQAGCATRAAPTSPPPGKSCNAARGTPASMSSFTASKATSGVCSAGLAATLLPAASAAAIWPMKIASGKFHGEMQTKTPRPIRRKLHTPQRMQPWAVAARLPIPPSPSSRRRRPPRPCSRSA